MSSMNQYVGFSLDTERYAVDIMNIEEIIRMAEITPVPKAPQFVEGIINIRGKVIPVVDLKKRLNLGEVINNNNSRIIITKISSKRVGFLVDSVDEVLRIEENIIESAPAVAMSVDSNYISGVAKTSKGLIIILDITKLFGSDSGDIFGF